MKMESNCPLKMKRKDLEQVSDEFSDFSLSAPARKIRRLDAELPPILEEVEDYQDVPIAEFEPYPSGQSFGSHVGRGVEIEELPNEPFEKETAIVLFKPVDTPLFQSPQNFSVDPKFISRLKNHAPWRRQSYYSLAQAEDEEPKETGNSDECLAVVPWVPSQLTASGPHCVSSQTDITEDMMMDAEDLEGATMEVEDNDISTEGRGIHDVSASVMAGNEGWQQWQQQHCMVPQPLQNVSTPITWYQ
ncbi:unnamed protein product [Cuscuta epithymum]|uniref:Uncharacterized protein n=1 Tax=Cuscuta epithymum TaxID=186058 RepID=A0AAV0CBP2_9ASTE|nr:unnamed protein product [Cuscuta epithymum]